MLSELDDLEKRLEQGPENPPPTKNKKILDWVEKVRSLVKPGRVHWCTGSKQENEEICSLLVKQGTFIPLNPKYKKNCFLARSDPRDVARVESRTWICTPNKEDTGPTNNWADPEEMKARLNKLFDGCMAGRTMYIIPFCMGPIGSPYSKFGIEITDSPYVVASMRIMTRMGLKVSNSFSPS
jgi:phosphoenolpyruvate carboxykinase (GTP)